MSQRPRGLPVNVDPAEFSMSEPCAIEAVGLVKRYGHTVALAGVDISVPVSTVSLCAIA